MINRNNQPEKSGTFAMLCAMTRPNGLNPAQAQPMPYGTYTIPMATNASVCIARLMGTIIGINGTLC